MANLTERYEWENGVHEWAEDEFITGGPEGPDNVPPRQLAGRTQFLASVALILQDLGAMGIKESLKTIRQRMQEGSVVIYNRGIKSGCAASKAGTARKVVLAAGAIFAKGMEMPCPGDQEGIVVPENAGEAALVCYGYLTVGADYATTFRITEAGAIVPAGGMPICRINVPAGSTAADLSDVALTDVRRYEAAYPTLAKSAPYASVALPYSVIDADYAALIDVTGYLGGWNQRPCVYAGEKASNGFKIFADGTLDEVAVQWKAIKLKL